MTTEKLPPPTEAEELEAARILRAVARNGGRTVTQELWEGVRGMATDGALEAIIRDPRNHQRVLLRYRSIERDEAGNVKNGQFFEGWHIPGGFIKPKESFRDMANRIGREDAKVGLHIIAGPIAVNKWMPGEHPVGFPISMVFVAEPIGEIIETETLKWFDGIPENLMDGPARAKHTAFLAHYWRSWLGNPNQPCLLID